MGNSFPGRGLEGPRKFPLFGGSSGMFPLAMRIDWASRRVHLSVRELADFRLGPDRPRVGRTGAWRAEAGQQWHVEARSLLPPDLAPAQGFSAAFEVPVEGILSDRGWAFEVQGRVDQVLTSPTDTVLREVKSVHGPLPAPAEDLVANFPDHLAQLAIYLTLFPAKTPIRGELLFIEIVHGVCQRLPFSGDPRAGTEARLRELTSWLIEQEQRRHLWSRAEVRPPFAVPRPGQTETTKALGDALWRCPRALFEAPTGFGKTAAVLQVALTGIIEGRWDRLVYVSSKSTGQAPVVEHLGRMLPPHSFRYLCLRNADEHACPEVPPEHFATDPHVRWAQLGLSAPHLFADQTIELEEIRRLGIETGIAPWEISKALLPWAEIWVGDLNYVFSPRHRGIFFDRPGFDPQRTLLVVDEAHNLPSRVASNWSHELDAASVGVLRRALVGAGAVRRLEVAVEAWEEFLEALPRRERLTDDEEDQVRLLLARLAEAIDHSWLDYDRLPEAAGDDLEALRLAARGLDQSGLERLLWSPVRGRLHLTCLDAAPLIRDTLLSFSHSLLMSATFQPLDVTYDRLGLRPQEMAFVEAQADWRLDRYRVAVDLRVDTRYSAREQHLPLTAETICLLAGQGEAPLAVFLPSYAYAKAIEAACAIQDPSLRIALPARGLPLPEQEAFLRDALISAHAIFLVLGTGFTEGIDCLGGRVQRAVVVGPALPEANPIQKARMHHRHHLPRPQALREVYLAPGLVRVNQALGRLVRAPGQQAAVLLHCRRFAEPAYQSLLAPEYRDVSYVETTADLLAWSRGGY